MLKADCLPKLLQEPDIALKEELQIIQAVFEHGDSIDAHAEGEAGNLLGIIAVVLHKLEDIGIDHATAENFDPSTLLAGTTGLAAALTASAADETGHHHFGAGFGERKERRAKAGLHARSEKRLHGVIERSF